MPNFTNNGLTLHYRESGSGNLLMVIPGNTASSALHDGELEYFGEFYHVVVPDLRGTGNSDRIPNWTISWWEDCSNDLAALIRHLGAKSCMVIGTSGGATIALLLAIKYPGLTSAIVADSCAEHFTPEHLNQEVLNRKLITEEQVAFWRLAHGDDFESVVNCDSQMLLELADHNPDLFAGNLSKVKCPVLITGSKNDSLIPDIEGQIRSMSNQIPNCQVYLSNNGDHPLMWTDTSNFRDVVQVFLNDHS